MFDEKVVFLRLILILLLSGLIGWERERHDRPAGFRTHILVGMGSALLMLISLSMVRLYPDSNADPGRIAAQVVSGIGFLGAGTIIREGFSVKGLTTAASLWAIAAIGLAVGGGYYFIGVVATFLVFVTLFFLSRLEVGMSVKRYKRLQCRMADIPGTLGNIGVVLGSENININNVKMEREVEGELLVEFELDFPKGKDNIRELNKKLINTEGLLEFNWHNL